MKKIKIKVELTAKHALANFHGCSVDEIEEQGDGIFSCGREEYFVLTALEADEKAEEYIENSLWAFKASFIIEQCGLHQSGAESLEIMQYKACEGANDFILSLIEKTCGINDFVDAAISADGRGHFLSGYGGKENQEGEYFIYRIN